MGDNPEIGPNKELPMGERMQRAGFMQVQAPNQKLEVTPENHPRTYLDHAADETVSLFSRVMLGESEAQSHSHDEVEKYGKMFVKAVPLFLDRKRAVSFTVGVYAADQASPEDPLGTQLTDFTLGGAKGFAMKRTLSELGAWKASPAIKGVGLGVVSRVTDVGLTRQTWQDANGDLSVGRGVMSTIAAAGDPRAVATDALLFGATEFTLGRLNYATKGALYRHPALPTVASAGIYGLGSGAGEELMRQNKAGEQFDFSKVMARGGASMLVNGLAGGIGGFDRMQRLRLTPASDRTASGEHQQPVPERVARFNELDARQRELQSPLTIKKQLNDVAWLAEVNSPGGAAKQVVFRVTDTPEMHMRMQNELLDYRMQRAMGADTRALTVAETEASINGATRRGYVQELAGRSFEDHLRATAWQRDGITTDRAAARALRSDPELMRQNEQVWLQKMLLGQWDNHAHNMIAHPGERKMSNIDLADPIRPAKYASDYLPSWGKTESRVSLLNDRLMSSLSGKPLSTESRTRLDSFVRDFDSSAGRQALQGSGHSAAQVDGILGRARTLAQDGKMPIRETPNLLTSLSLRALYHMRKADSPRFEQSVKEKPAEQH